MTPSKRYAAALVFALALPAAPIPGAIDAGDPAPRAKAARPFFPKVHVRVWDEGAVAPNVSVSVPTWVITTMVRVGAVTGLFDYAIAHARRHCVDGGDCAKGVRLDGRQIDAIWSALASSGPASLVEVDDGRGVRVEIRVD